MSGREKHVRNTQRVECASHIRHTFGPVYDARSRVLILGTMPSPKSREYGFYYGHPRNRFWPVMAALFDAPLPQTNAEKEALVRAHGVALWDVLASCTIMGASDASIRDPEPNDIGLVLRAAEIRVIYTTGSKAAELYRRYCLPQTGIPAVTLPSTSPANARMRLADLIRAYRVILNDLNGGNTK